MGGYLFCVFLGITGMALVHFYERKRQQRIWDWLEVKIENARNGNFNVSAVDETRLSSLETSIHHFLADSHLAKENVNQEKERIQTLISDISHQTVTPISNILLYSQLLEEQMQDFELLKEVSAIREQTEKLDFLINSLVKISRMENGIISTISRIGNVFDMLKEIVTKAEPKAKEKNIILCLEEHEEACACYDPKWTPEALFNIVDNAVKYTNCGGTVHLSVLSYMMFLRIDIKDNGTGMTPEELPKIFSRFYRCERANTKPGVGLGLYLAREIINGEGGYIKTASTLGEGTTFSIFLPKSPTRANISEL